MNKKKLTIGIIICILLIVILSIGIKVDETGFHALIRVEDNFIDIF